jgi:Divergent InlB B-repeat domain
VTSSPAGINCGTDCTETYASVTGVTLTAHPEGSAAFAGWSGACTGSGLTCTLTMDRSRLVTATFTTKPVLTVTKSGSGQGTVTSMPAGIDCGTDCNEPYNEGTSVTLTADPAASSSFKEWSGACTGSTPTCAVTLNVSKEAIATFTLKQYNLHVSTIGDGEVTSDPVGIDCGTTGTDCDQTYEHGTPVTLTATPAPLPVPNTVTWGGACDGAQGLTCSLMMDGPKPVTATFDPVPQSAPTTLFRVLAAKEPIG